MNLKKLNAWWQQYQANHPKIAGLVVLVESTIVGAGIDLVVNGVDFSKQGLKHAATIIGTAVVIAVRNYLKTNAIDLRTKLGTPDAAQSIEGEKKP